jgi:predicted CoA-substrate-specific enzyme activase
MRLGLDVGSTTLKCVALDDYDKIIYKEYARHMSRIAENAAAMLERARKALGETYGKEAADGASVVISGSAGMGIATDCGIPFVQEVWATRTAVKRYVPAADVVIELGGEDAKILFLGEDTEVRMNGSCAGGTGAFIDQMATLLGMTADGMNEAAAKHEKIYTVASRCGVFAKSDIQPLLNQGASKNDICASIFYAVVNQTIAGLAQGRELTGNVLYLGGPLTFLPELDRAFDDVLKTKGTLPDNSLYFVAAGAAMSPAGDRNGRVRTLAECVDLVAGYKGQSDYRACPPLFSSREEYDAFCERHKRTGHLNVAVAGGGAGTTDAETDAQKAGAAKPSAGGRPLPIYFGVDAGSTTVKAVATDERGDILFERYEAGKGSPVDTVRRFIAELYEALPDAKIVSAAATGYGEELIRAAFGFDLGVVETIAHFTAAKRFLPDVDFIIDIGGQDIKCFRIKNGAIDSIFLNEACSSGCGSFLQTFANALGYSVSEFAELGLFAPRPVDLGSRCTVFMNSSVKQAQKDGATVGAISAGLSISVVKNALYKVIRAPSPDSLGEHIVVQGGTFLNDAVLRAFEMELGRDVVRPAVAGLMGAYGAALCAMERAAETGATESTLISRGELADFTYTSQAITCRGCSNACRLTVNRFGTGEGAKKYISGNRCEKPLATSDQGGVGTKRCKYNMYEYKWDRLSRYMNTATPESVLETDAALGGRGVIGIPLGLNIYELLPFWHAFFSSLGFTVMTSPPSNRKLYLLGQHSIPSDTVCFPAKLLHGHVESLVDAGVRTVFYPCMSYNFDESLGDNHYNCPVVAYYPEVIAANVGALASHGTRLLHCYVGPHRRGDFPKKIFGALREYWPDIAEREVAAAARAAYAEYEGYLADVRAKGDEYIAAARAEGFPVIILAGRPYHLDPEVNHGIASLIADMGAAVVSEDSLSFKRRYPTRVLNQWTYHSRLYAAAHYVAEADFDCRLVQLVSFGCGVDAITTDEVRSILESAGKLYTQIKIDEITNLGAVRIRLRSLMYK